MPVVKPYRGARMYLNRTKLVPLCAVLAAALGCAAISHAATPDGPSFACDKVTAGSIEAMVCSDASLAEARPATRAVYAAATKKAINEHPPVLKAEQRGWIKGRNACWKQPTCRPAWVKPGTRCASPSCRPAIAGLRAPGRCATPATVTRPTSRGDLLPDRPAHPHRRARRQRLVDGPQRSGSGANYQGRNESLLGAPGRGAVTWGYGAPPKRCVKKP